jgi:hypothetical protein
LFSVPSRHVTPAPQSATAVATAHGFPLFAPERQMSLLNAPFWLKVCPAQNTLHTPVPTPVQHDAGVPAPVQPVLSNVPVRLDVPVVSGLRLIGMSPMNCAHVPPPAQSPDVLHTLLLFVPRKHRWPPAPATAAGAGQSLECPFGFFDVHAAPWFGLPSHTPTHGAPGDPTHAAPPTATAQIGHGCVGFDVRIVREFNWKFHVAAPVAVSSVPLGATGETVLPNVFVTHTDNPAFEIGSGVPNRQPTSVQSTPAGVDPDGVGPMLQVVPTQPESVNRFVAPGGVALSGTCEMPPPSDSCPQRRFFSGTVPARSRNVLPQLPDPGVDRKSKPDGPPPDVVVVVDEVLEIVVLELDVVGASVDVVVDDVVAAMVLDDDVVAAIVLDDDVVGGALLVEDVVVVETVVGGPDVDVDEVVGVGPGLHAAGRGPTIPGTDAAPEQSTPKSLTQSTQPRSVVASVTGPPQLAGG